MQHIKSLLRRTYCLYRKSGFVESVWPDVTELCLSGRSCLIHVHKTAKIFWENRTRSTELQLTDKAGLTQVIVKDLAEGSYVFEVCTYDTHGNSSIMSEVPCTVYGDVYEKLLFNTKVKTAVLKNDVLTITFAASLEPTFFGSEITYTSIDGGDKTVILKAARDAIKIDVLQAIVLFIVLFICRKKLLSIISIVNRMNLKLNKEDRKNA